MKFSYNWLKEYVPHLPKPAKLAELLNMHAFEVESIERHGKDFVLDINILPNRIGDASGHAGLARDIAAILGIAIKTEKYALTEAKRPAKDTLRVEVKTPLCLRYAARVMFGITVGPSPRWLKERLEVCGIRSINNIVDATNYVMLETGQPLHAFDYMRVDGERIIVRTARENEAIDALDDNTYKLMSEMMVIADAKGPLAIAGIKGGTDAGISNDTKCIVLESATFDASTIRKTSQELRLRTDASVRFSVGLDPNLAGEALTRVAMIIQDIAGGEILKGAIDIYPKRRVPRVIKVRHAYIESLLGETISSGDVMQFLKRLGFGMQKGGNGVYIVAAPTIRGDIEREEDIVEEIGRLYGYEHVRPQHPLGELVPPEEQLEHIWSGKTKDMFADLGFREVYNYSFVGVKDIALLGETPSEYFELANPTRPEYAYMRRSLASGLLGNVRENLKYDEYVRFFELGPVYRRTKKEGHIVSYEPQSLGVIVGARGKDKDATLFFELKGSVANYMERMGLEAEFEDALGKDYPLLHPYRAAIVRVRGEIVGVLGEVHPAVCEDAGIKGSAALYECDFEKLATLISEEKEFRPISKYPSVVRDLSLILPLDARVDDVLDVIENTAGKLLVDTDLFDLYRGDEIGEDKKSLAFHLVLQAEDRTLKDIEVDEVVDRVIKALEEHLDWEVRK